MKNPAAAGFGGEKRGLPSAVNEALKIRGGHRWDRSHVLPNINLCGDRRRWAAESYGTIGEIYVPTLGAVMGKGGL